MTSPSFASSVSTMVDGCVPELLALGGGAWEGCPGSGPVASCNEENRVG
jgi:hypothetical protein